VALALGVAILHEPFTVAAAAGFVLILLGSFLATRRTREPAKARRRTRAADAEMPIPTAGVR
jgi:drug/metabolite transporter (DMT)-like permease